MFTAPSRLSSPSRNSALIVTYRLCHLFILTMPLTPLVLSPTLPSELLTYIANHAHHPTTLLICSTRDDFLSTLVDDVKGQTEKSATGNEINTSAQDQDQDLDHQPPVFTDHRLLHAPLHLVARTRHIRTLFVPTVSHLRALLATLDPADSKIPPPPPPPPTATQITSNSPPLLLVYGMLELHRDTSEWSAQGLGTTMAGLVEASARLGMRAVVVEPRGEEMTSLEEVLHEGMPLLSSSARRLADGDEGWSGRRVEVGRVLGRWFEAKNVSWGDGPPLH